MTVIEGVGVGDKNDIGIVGVNVGRFERLNGGKVGKDGSLINC